MTWMVAVIAVSVVLNLVFVIMIASLKYQKTAIASKETEVPEPARHYDVAKFYNEQTDNFLKVYGKVIQAFRTKNVDTLLDYQVDTIGLKPGMTALDAGCGICGPAVYFAKKAGCHIEAITISAVQVEKAEEHIGQHGAGDQVTVREGDYHMLEAYYPENCFDAVYFLESFGHAKNHEQVLDSAWKVMRPGGVLYIKRPLHKKSRTKRHGAGH